MLYLGFFFLFLPLRFGFHFFLFIYILFSIKLSRVCNTLCDLRLVWNCPWSGEICIIHSFFFLSNFIFHMHSTRSGQVWYFPLFGAIKLHYFICTAHVRDQFCTKWFISYMAVIIYAIMDYYEAVFIEP